MRIGLLGGTFDPIHNGHLALARSAWRSLKLDRILFIPGRCPPHKQVRTGAAAQDRYEMVTEALKGQAGLEVSRVELDRPGPSYTVDTLRFLKLRYARQTELIFLAGADCLPGLETWYQFDELLKLCRFVVVSRPGFPVLRAPRGVSLITLPTPDLSSYELRARLSRSENVSSSIPKGAYRIIQLRRLYGSRRRAERGT